MRLRLRRFAEFGDDGTFGELTIGEFRCYTVELPWRENKPFISRIPPGLYKMVPHRTGGDAGTWALVGGTVSHKKEEGYERYVILIHIANTVGDILGCIGPGLSMGYVKRKRAVLSSGAAMRYISGLLDYDDQHEILIEDKMGGWAA